MKCPECVKEGKKSKVFIGTSTRTLMYWQPHYDEDGVLHSNDPNKTTTDYSCSNGHKWSVTTGGLDAD